MSEGPDDGGANAAPGFGDPRATPNPYGVLVAKEVERAEADLVAVRARAISVLTTVAAVVTLVTGAVTFAASKSEAERGLPDVAVVLLGGGLLGIVVAAVLAIRVQAPCVVQKPMVDALRGKVTIEGWSDGEDSFERERIVADAMMNYLDSLRRVVDEYSGELLLSVRLLAAGLVLIAGSAVWAASSV